MPIQAQDARDLDITLASIKPGTDDILVHAVADPSTGTPILPATAANQTAANTTLASILAALAALATDAHAASILGALQGTLAVSAASLPLPAGAATAAQLPATLGQKDSLHSLPVVLSSDGPFIQAVGTSSDAAQSDPTQTASLVAVLKGLLSVERPIQGAVALTPADTGSSTVGRMLAVNCTVAGNVSLVFADGSNHVIPVSVGYTTLPFAVTRVNVTGTTATATYANLK